MEEQADAITRQLSRRRRRVEDLQAAISDVRDQNRQCADEDEQETMTRWKEQGTPEIIEDVDREAFMEKAHAYWEENLSPEELEVYNSILSVK